MRFRGFLDAAAGWRSLMISSILFSGTYAKNEPSISWNKFDHEPMNIVYFDKSDVIMFQDFDSDNVYRSEDAGASWNEAEGLPEGLAWTMHKHPFDTKRAYILTPGGTHYKTDNQGKTWDKFQTGIEETVFTGRLPLTFNAGDPDKIIFNGMDCQEIFCKELSMYTTDGFATDAKVLRSDTGGCYWAKSTKLFTTGRQDWDEDRIICVAKGKYSDWVMDYRLVISDNYFQAESYPELEPGQLVTGIVNMRIAERYLVAAASSQNTDEMALYVSDDTVKWHRAVFPHDHKLMEEAYTLLESTNYSIRINVMTSNPSSPMGVLFSSNSNGTYYTRNMEHMNQNFWEIVDFETVAGIQGIIVVNTVDNWEAIEEDFLSEKKLVSSISFDDGRTWQGLKIKGENDRLHLHLVTEMTNDGRVLSSRAPGILMGIGNTGEYLEDIESGDTYVSDDAGMTWTLALNGPHKYEFGDQGSVLVAIKMGGADEIQYSLDHGDTWKPANLPEKDLKAEILTTSRDSTTLKFLLTGRLGEGLETKYLVMSIDFEEMHERKCGEGDIEDWYARLDADGKATCLMGHKQHYLRRKKDADCFMREVSQGPVPEFTRCPCTDADFECNFNFVRDETDKTKCVLKGPLVIPEGECKDFDESTTFTGPSSWRLIPGNECERTSGTQKDDPIERKCSGLATPPTNENITHTKFDFPGEIAQKVYLERTESSTGDDETIIVRVVTQVDTWVYISRDHGKTWNEIDILKGVEVVKMIRHKYFNDVIYFLTASKVVYYSIDRGNNIRRFGKNVPNNLHLEFNPNPMSFHPRHKDWFIWVGVEDCEAPSDGKEGNCDAIASLTKDRGDNWQTLKRYVYKCEFTDDAAGQRRMDQDKLIYCMARAEESPSAINNPWQLVSSKDFFEEEILHVENLVDFATESEFVVAATKKDGEDLKASTSVDGTNFTEARFPPNFKAPEYRSAYTILDSSTRALFMSVMVGNWPDYKYGTILKSNSYGTSYVISLNAANQDNEGYVDFERMLGVDGVALANIVTNPDTAVEENVKNLKTVITHNDGADWLLLRPPEFDARGEKSNCTTQSDQCSLHIHGYTERNYYSHKFSSPSAIGIMFGVGNVGKYLGDRKNADTFITTDAGVTWKSAMEGTYMWAFGDQGSILVLVKENEPTNIVYYSLDEGEIWEKFHFSSEDEKFLIVDITTVPSDNSKNFVLWAEESEDRYASAINLDFSGIWDRQCTLDETDYYTWMPEHPSRHPSNDKCLFGHVSEYHRKNPSSECFNGRLIDRLHNIASNCTCTRHDFECDYNYYREEEGICRLAQGAEPQSGADVCAAPGTFKYHDPSGYRRIPLSTCEGGKEMDKAGEEHICPGKYNFTVFGLLAVIIIPILLAATFGWWVWRNWNGKFGQIRLGESTFDEEAPYIKYPVMAISAVAALVIAFPALSASIWHGVSSLFGGRKTARFTTRSSFSRGTDYVHVDEDEGELLGDESDEDV